MSPLTWLRARPAIDRRWTPEHRVAPYFQLDGDLLRVQGVRSFRWRSSSDYVPSWIHRRFDLGSLRGLWYVVTPFLRSWRGPAHTLLSFQFGESDFLTLSVEARREVGERYGLLKGMFRRFELIYVAGDEADVLVHRALHRGDQVFVFPVRVAPARIRELLMSMADSANGLLSRPEFYHTMANNCTTRIVRHVNRVVPGRIPAGWRVLIPGYSDVLAHRLGLLEVGDSIREARDRWLMNDRIRRWEGDPEFSRKIREGVDLSPRTSEPRVTPSGGR